MADAAAATADASGGEQIELEDSLLAYLESHADTTPADLCEHLMCAATFGHATDAERRGYRRTRRTRRGLLAGRARSSRKLDALREAEAAFRQPPREPSWWARTTIQQRHASARCAEASSDAERPAKRRRGNEVDAQDTAAGEARPPSMAVRTLDAREARSHGRQLKQSGYCGPRRIGDRRFGLIRGVRRASSFHPTEEFRFLPQRRFRAADPAQRRLEPLRRCSLASRPPRRASRASASSLQANATLYSAATNASSATTPCLAFSVVVHASRPRPRPLD